MKRKPNSKVLIMKSTRFEFEELDRAIEEAVLKALLKLSPLKAKILF